MSQSTIAAPARWQVDPAMVKRVAVLCGNYLYVARHHDPRVVPFEMGIAVDDAGETLAEIIEQSLGYECGALWLLRVRARPAIGDHPVIRAWPQRAAGFLASHAADDLLVHPISAGRMSKSLAGLVVQRRGDHGRGVGIPMGVYAPWVEDAWGVGAAIAGLGELYDWMEPRVFAEGVALAAYALGTQLRFSPSYTGQQVLRRTLAHRKVAIPALSPEGRELVDAHRPTYAQWSRALPATALRIVKYDRNSSFVASFGEVPCGDPVRTPSYVPRCPGLYHVVSFSPPRDWPGALPGPFRIGEVGAVGEYPHGGSCWAWEPQIRLAFARCWSIAIDDGWYWPRAQTHDLGRVWREAIWRARGEAEAHGGPAGRVAKAIIKRAGVAAVGRFLQSTGHEVMDAGEAAAAGLDIESLETDDDGEFTGMAEVRAALGRSDLLQPAWWSHIIANATERMWSALYAHAAVQPVAAYIDAVYGLGDWPADDPALSPGLGKWKRESSVSLDEERVAAWNAASSANARINLYARWVGEGAGHGEA